MLECIRVTMLYITLVYAQNVPYKAMENRSRAFLITPGAFLMNPKDAII